LTVGVRHTNASGGSPGASCSRLLAYALDGIAVGRSLHDWLVQDVADSDSLSGVTAAIFLPGGRVPREGHRLAQEDLARSLQLIASQGARAGFYEETRASRMKSCVSWRRGQPVQMVTDWNDNVGHAHAIGVDREQGFFEGGADPRGDGAALGY
jgi:gamma-glutamyltranspeptidase